MNRFARIVLFIVCSTISAVSLVVMNPARASDDAPISSIIDDSFSERASTKYRIINIDGEGYYTVRPKEVAPGTHQLSFGTFTGDLPGVFNTVTCSTEPGYIYRVNERGCFKYERRMDFKGAADYWAKTDAELKVKKEAAAVAAKEAEEEKETLEYLGDKSALEDAKTTSDVDRVISSLKWRLSNGIHNDDPDNLMPQALQKRSVFEKAEAKENARLEAERKREEAKLAKEESIRMAAERRQLDSFRKSLKEGDETNCGPVIQTKNKLVQISFAVANYGNEHWIRRDMIFPSGYGCRFINGQYQPPQQF